MIPDIYPIMKKFAGSISEKYAEEMLLIGESFITRTTFFAKVLF